MHRDVLHNAERDYAMMDQCASRSVQREPATLKERVYLTMDSVNQAISGVTSAVYPSALRDL